MKVKKRKRGGWVPNALRAMIAVMLCVVVWIEYEKLQTVNQMARSAEWVAKVADAFPVLDLPSTEEPSSMTCEELPAVEVKYVGWDEGLWQKVRDKSGSIVDNSTVDFMNDAVAVDASCTHSRYGSFWRRAETSQSFNNDRDVVNYYKRLRHEPFRVRRPVCRRPGQQIKVGRATHDWVRVLEYRPDQNVYVAVDLLDMGKEVVLETECSLERHVFSDKRGYFRLKGQPDRFVAKTDISETTSASAKSSSDIVVISTALTTLGFSRSGLLGGGL